jgi:hypothetical protein
LLPCHLTVLQFHPTSIQLPSDLHLASIRHPSDLHPTSICRHSFLSTYRILQTIHCVRTL